MRSLDDFFAVIAIASVLLLGALQLSGATLGIDVFKGANSELAKIRQDLGAEDWGKDVKRHGKSASDELAALMR